MEHMQQKQISTDPCGPKVQPNPCALIGAGPGLPPQLAIQEPSLISPSDELKRQSGLSPMQAALAPMKETDQMQSGSTPETVASISRPRPTALGTKPTPNTTRVSVDPFKEIDLIPVCIPGPQSPNVLLHSPTESSFSLHSQSPHSPQSYASQPYLNPNPSLPPSLSPKPSLSPQPQRTPSPGSSTQSQVQSEKPGGENNDFRVYIVTWNVGSAVPPDDITSLFGPNVSDGSVDMFIIGLQEVNSMINKRLKDVLFSDQWSEHCMDTLCPFGYVLVASQRMQGVLLLVFSKFCHLPFLRGVQTESTRTGLGGYWGNKGGVSARMTIFGHPVCFLNCHLPAHMRNLEQRMEDFESILQQQQFEGGTATGVLDHDVVFWFGDLNFRIEDYDIHVVKCAIDSNKLPLLLERDQLNMAKNTESILEGFMEGPLKFPPTYKFDVGTHKYDTSAKKRKPAWTDRILWRLRRTGSPVPTHNAALQRGLTSWLGGATKVTQHVYRSHMGFTISDHKPVSALFSLHFPFKVDMPLVELQVNKEWCKVSDATVRFTVASTYQRSSWDWVAIYKVGFRHHKDYQVYIWAKGEHATQVTFAEEDLPRDDCDYILGYYSNNMNSIVGLSTPVQIKIPVHSPTVQRSDSSDISSEDDSTLVLLAPNSRSPSPKTGKHHHHHRRSRSPAVPALSSNPLPSLQGLSLGPRSKEGQTRSRSPCCAAKKERLVSPNTVRSPTISPLSPRSPVSPGGGVTAPEALIAAILGEHRPPQVSPTGSNK
ncbi:inositol polyphosphate 5-phosphatase K isoform X1 [Micropterus dolomieu]|uniref:inositol polyphosphate 5-phosphatase K isoform X1 n=1 Tax=Micropterus dolomieu TaxID=147949 RepID=UPI001E8DC56B|nr:inositol polyphosphate 5-phosphatase K isoform X1 [Micropterus dolomieu]XP_045923349.1 inositol polyphosphate 5-phosphatase K isoform X1 [Micropterus dolomieu]XP_045923350.1 inositol polyphosphate 5-phosphatase K isoform X1 [Micropterus dolomieu]XP_045923351.1 inositol polyphosphate 5-phosphatase K isoform X1 [Micropterus dolomieu]